MIDSERSIYPLDSNKKKEKKTCKKNLFKNKQTSKTKVYQNLSIEKKNKKSGYTTIMIKKYILQYIAQASFCDGFHSYF